MALLTPEQTLSQLKMMEDRWASMRSHPRATASLRLRLEWDEGEARRTANGLTVDVSHSGCMAVLRAKSYGAGTKPGKWGSHSPSPTWDSGELRFRTERVTEVVL